MPITKKTGIVLVINIVLLISLLIALLFLLQKGAVKTESIEELAEKALLEKNARDLYTEATETYYFETHPEELTITSIKMSDVKFMESDGTENAAKEYNAGDDIPISLSVYDYVNPKADDYEYIYGIQIWVETADSDGNKVASMSGLAVDTTNYNPAKGMKIPFNIMITPDESVKPGNYKVNITAFDMISNLEAVKEEEFTII
jgi:hypothetical protein